MASKKAPKKDNKPRSKEIPQPAGSSGSYLRALVSRPMRQFFMIIAVIILLVVFQKELNVFFEKMRTLFGWGVIFLFITILVLITMAWRRQLGSLIRHWNIWLGSISFVLAIWGILGIIEYNSTLFSNGLGGTFGYTLVGSPSPYSTMDTFLGSLRILALAIIGIILVAPGASFRAVRNSIIWLSEKLSRPPSPKSEKRPVPTDTPRVTVTRPPIGEKPPLPSIMHEPLVPPEVTTSRKRLEDLAEKAAVLKKAAARPPDIAKPADTSRKSDTPRPAEAGLSGEELRQVAEDVWKKYGQSPELVVVDGWRLPPIDILDISPEVQFSQADNVQRSRLIEETLASYGVEAKVVQINAGPTVTQFGIEPGWDRKFKEIKTKDEDGNVQVRMEEVSKTRVKVERINSLANDMALALAAPTIRIEAPVPGKGFVGIEVPNTTSDMVSLRGVVETSAFQKLETKTRMALALGKGAGGEAIAADLTKMPHLLIAGATGSGKTVCLNTIICCLLMHNTPNDVRFILVDPKRVELVQYNSIPHLATPVITDSQKAIDSLRWLLEEMNGRFQKFSTSGARHIEGYNKDKEGKDKLPYLVLIIDELADLMMAGFDEVESSLCRLAQMARATGIHLVIATQRPSVDVVTGLIKANFPTRISFAVTSQVDSRTVLDSAGAEKLLGQGDMLYMPTEAAKPKRLQGCFLSDPEIDRLVYFWASQQKEEPDELRMETLVATAPSGTIGGHPRDPLLEQAKELARQYSDVSTSFLQRKLHIGYPRAARLKEQLDAVLQQEAEKEQEIPPTDGKKAD
jgi:S-DNA-T family DNA segregation ATPase FtsK/SpoIIIE